MRGSLVCRSVCLVWPIGNLLRLFVLADWCRRPATHVVLMCLQCLGDGSEAQSSNVTALSSILMIRLLDSRKVALFSHWYGRICPNVASIRNQGPLSGGQNSCYELLLTATDVCSLVFLLLYLFSEIKFICIYIFSFRQVCQYITTAGPENKLFLLLRSGLQSPPQSL